MFYSEGWDLHGRAHGESTHVKIRMVVEFIHVHVVGTVVHVDVTFTAHGWLAHLRDATANAQLVMVGLHMLTWDRGSLNAVIVVHVDHLRVVSRSSTNIGHCLGESGLLRSCGRE